MIGRAEVRRSFITTTVRDEIPGHTTRAPPVGFELETNSFQFYAIANLYKTSLGNDAVPLTALVYIMLG